MCTSKSVIVNHLDPSHPQLLRPAPHPLTLRGGRLRGGEPLGLQHLVVAAVGDLQHEAAVHHAVAGLEVAVTHAPVVEVLHALAGGAGRRSREEEPPQCSR